MILEIVSAPEWTRICSLRLHTCKTIAWGTRAFVAILGDRRQWPQK